LLLGNSNDSGQWMDGKKRHELVRDRLAELYGEPVEVIPRNIWPRESLADVVDGWIEQYHPDVIYLTMAAYWFSYRSVPLRVKRLMGALGERAGDAGFRVAESPRWAYNRAFRAARAALQSTIGGDTHFTTDEVIDRMQAVIRRCIRHEGLTLAIQGADGRTAYSRSRRGRARDEARRQRVHAAMKAFCAEHHVVYENSETPLWATDRTLAKNRVGDGLHANAEWHAHSANLIAATIQHGLEAAGQAPVRRPATSENGLDLP
jgi:hypothetical protein